MHVCVYNYVYIIYIYIYIYIQVKCKVMDGCLFLIKAINYKGPHDVLGKLKKKEKKKG